jgi:hypothetical protein
LKKTKHFRHELDFYSIFIFINHCYYVVLILLSTVKYDVSTLSPSLEPSVSIAEHSDVIDLITAKCCWLSKGFVSGFFVFYIVVIGKHVIFTWIPGRIHGSMGTKLSTGKLIKDALNDSISNCSKPYTFYYEIYFKTLARQLEPANS